MKLYNFFKKAFALAMMVAFVYPTLSAAEEGSRLPAKKSPLAWSQRKQIKEPSTATKKALSGFPSKKGKSWKLRFNPVTGSPESMMGGESSKRYHGRSIRERASAFLMENADMLEIDFASLKPAGESAFLNLNHVRYQQYYKGLPVEFAYATVHIKEDGTVTGYQSSYHSDLNMDISPSVSLAQAMQSANSDAGTAIRVSSHTLVVFPDNVNGKSYLAWKLRGRPYDGSKIWVYYIDAKTGDVLFRYDDMRRATCTSSDPQHFDAHSDALVYEISPDYTNPFRYGTVAASTWQGVERLSLKPIADQYIWIKDYSNRMVTTHTGTASSTGAFHYENGVWVSSSCAEGKIFSSFKGPYFTVTNMRGRSAHWDNGLGKENNLAVLSKPINERPYANNMEKDFGRVYITPNLETGHTLARQYPIFSAPFDVGELSNSDLLVDSDEVYIYDMEGNRHGSYIGSRTNSFLGPSIEGTDFKVYLHSNESGTNNGFTIERSSYIALTNNPGVTRTGSNDNNIHWSTAAMATHDLGIAYVDSSVGANGTYGIDEANAFYHLNKMRRYFLQFNKLGTTFVCNFDSDCENRKPINLDKHIDVMVHASGDIDSESETPTGMYNAFFDLEQGNIMIGDGIWDGYNTSYAFRSFALDGTIIRHEYTHFVVHQIYNIINFGEFGAISEALSDYFSLASLWQEGDNYDGHNAEGYGNWNMIYAKKNLSALGNFVLAEPRDLSKTDKVMPGSWTGELYNDSQILSQALYSLRKGACADRTSDSCPLIGLYDNLESSRWGNVPVADLVVFASLFYFPDSFSGFHEAMYDACGWLNELEGAGTCYPDRITTAFSAHGMTAGGTTESHDSYESAAGGMCKNNNGPECAADITDERTVQARIYPAGDLDYYTFTANEGTFTAQLSLPLTEDYDYHAYTLTLFDSKRNMLAMEIPVLDSSAGSDLCEGDMSCVTNNGTVTLTYQLPSSGRYYLAISAPDARLASDTVGISPEHSEDYYTLKTEFIEQGHISARLLHSAYDNDVIRFEAPVIIAPTTTNNIIIESTATFSTDYTIASENYFSHVQLWDIRGNKLDKANSLYTPSVDRLIEASNIKMSPSGVISGDVAIQSGFAAKYPAIGSVILEVFGYNHMGAQISLGKSEPVNLTASGVRFETYNNIMLKGSGVAMIRYSVNSSGRLVIKAYTQSGKLVKVIADQQVVAGEQGNKSWDGTNDKGSKVASGIYYIKAEGPGLDKIEKIAIVR